MNREPEGRRVGGGRKRLLDLLPEVYRLGGGDLLERYLGAAQELLDDLEGRRGGAEADPKLWPLRGRAHDAHVGNSLAGTPLGVALWLEPAIPRPAFWNGVQVRALDRGRLEVVGVPWRAAVLAWSRRDLREPPENFQLPGGLLPAGSRVQAVLLDKLPVRRIPLVGARLRGEVFWTEGNGTLFRGGEELS